MFLRFFLSRIHDHLNDIQINLQHCQWLGFFNCYEMGRKLSIACWGYLTCGPWVINLLLLEYLSLTDSFGRLLLFHLFIVFLHITYGLMATSQNSLAISSGDLIDLVSFSGSATIYPLTMSSLPSFKLAFAPTYLTIIPADILRTIILYLVMSCQCIITIYI